MNMNTLTDDENFDARILLCEACGRGFAHMNAYSNHIGSCRKQKKRVLSALGAAKEKYRNKKARLEPSMQLCPHEVGQQPPPVAAIDVRNSNFMLVCSRVLILHRIDCAHPRCR